MAAPTRRRTPGPRRRWKRMDGPTKGATSYSSPSPTPPTGPHDTKPAHWVDASIHADELTATVAACHVLQHLVDGYVAGDEQVIRALRSRTFYVVPRVNPDGAEWVLADTPRVPALECASLAVPRWPPVARSADRGHRRRRPDPADAHPRPDRRVDAASRRAAAAGRRPARRSGPSRHASAIGCSARARSSDYDGFTVPTPAPPRAST